MEGARACGEERGRRARAGSRRSKRGERRRDAGRAGKRRGGRGKRAHRTPTVRRVERRPPASRQPVALRHLREGAAGSCLLGGAKGAHGAGWRDGAPGRPRPRRWCRRACARASGRAVAVSWGGWQGEHVPPQVKARRACVRRVGMCDAAEACKRAARTGARVRAVARAGDGVARTVRLRRRRSLPCCLRTRNGFEGVRACGEQAGHAGKRATQGVASTPSRRSSRRQSETWPAARHRRAPAALGRHQRTCAGARACR